MNYTYSSEPISLTLLAKSFSNININRDMLLNFLMEKGYILNIRTPTNLGLTNGVSVKYSEDNGCWLVYNHQVQKLILNNVDYILEKYKDMIKMPKEKVAKEKKKKEEDTTVEKFIPTKHNIVYPSLGIDDFVIVDTETTGLSRNDEVIELAIVDMTGKILYHSLFTPSVEVNPAASKVNGYTKESLENEKLFKDEWNKIKRIIGYRTVLCHNTSFDKRMILQTLDKYGLNPNEGSRMFSNCYDSMKIAKQFLNAKSYGLEYLANMIGIKEKELHNAKDDCLLTLKFLKKLEELVYYKKIRWVYENTSA